jgi:alanine racemase
LKLNYEYRKIASLLSSASELDTIIDVIGYDSRKLSHQKNVLFFALNGVFRDGHAFIEDAYSKGVRHFIVMNQGCTNHLLDAHEIVVEDSFSALQTLAHFHRSQFDYPVVAITGSYGKTTVKEWLSEILSEGNKVVRSPKSYNSRLGVALSLFEMNDTADFALIEAGISEPGDMEYLSAMITPTHGIFTSLGAAHLENFDSKEELKKEKVALFKEAKMFIHPNSIHFDENNSKAIDGEAFSSFRAEFPLANSVQWLNAQLAIAMAKELGVSDEIISRQLSKLAPLSMRLETFDGINNNLILNDAYNLDIDSLRHALEYQQVVAGDKPRIVIIGLTRQETKHADWINALVESFSPETFILHYPDNTFNHSFENSSILIKGSREAKMEIIAGKFKRLKHQTFLQIDFGAIRDNIRVFKSNLRSKTKLLCMVKASSYGSDATKMGRFLEQLGVDYLGVAYPSEGVELREHGVKLPILVMNCEEDAFATCIAHKLEPAIYSLTQLDTFIQELILQGSSFYPIHLKLETGMNRLGFHADVVDGLIQKLNAQPEVHVASVYSHLAESNLENSIHVQDQIDRFKEMTAKIQAAIPYPILCHILNSEGIINYSEAQFDMVRLGIGMYGITENRLLKRKLSKAIEWYSAVSQIKSLKKGDAVGYGRGFIADKDMEIAVIPVGYADGYSRQLSNGVGGVYIQNSYCPTVGSVCMDMIMVDVTGLEIYEKDPVEIIGSNQSIYALAAQMGTIPYEVMTHFSMRMHRKFIEG